MAAATIDRRDFIKAVGGLSAGMLAPAELGDASPLPEANSARSGPKPNFLVLVSDDQCFRTINALNNREVHTPAFDRLVARGTAFTHCFHQGSWSQAVCVPSRAMLHTGRYLWNCGGDECGYFPVLGEVLQMGGYGTHLIGKWHNGEQSALRSFTTGKHIGPPMYVSGPLSYNRPRPDNPWTPWDPQFRGHWTPNVWDFQALPRKDLWSLPVMPNPVAAGPTYEVKQHSCELYADSAVELLSQMAAHREEPFLLYLAWNSPHDPRQAPREFVDRYPPGQIAVPPNFLSEHPFDQGDHYVRDENLAPFPRTRKEIQVHRSEYYALITYMDRQLGRILDTLEKTGLSENTYVIVTGDHGLAVGEHGLMGKQNLYDCSVRMPFIVAGPGIAAGRRIDSLVYQHCLFPTVCDLAGLPTPATVQFPSLLPLLGGSSQPLFDSIYCAYRGFQRMVRTNRWKLILYPEIKEVQLFDLEADPWEINDLARRPAYSQTVGELFRQLTKWQEIAGDTLRLESRS